MTFNVVHRTVYEYASPVTVSHHAARVEPRVLPQQQVKIFRCTSGPTPAVIKPRVDFFGNHVCGFSIQEIHRHLEITAHSTVTVSSATPPAPALSPDWEGVVKLFSDPVSPEVVVPYQFVLIRRCCARRRNWPIMREKSFDPKTPLLVAVADLNRRIFSDFKFDPTATTVATPLEEVLEKRRGVCQDFAHLAIASLRSLGLPARYVSGYLRTRPPTARNGSSARTPATRGSRCLSRRRLGGF